MTKTVSLLFGVHAHQPVGNFPEVLDDAHARCYRPFLQTLHKFPEFRFAMHFSGWLLDYLLEKFPRDMELLHDMVARGQVELFGAGDCEPVLAVIPHRDRVGQIARLSDRLERKFGQRPQGAWLTERVWEATVVPALADSGIRYVTVDDYHFLCTGRSAAELTGHFTTEEDGRTLDLFPISEALRYKLPFSPAGDAVAYLESLAAQDAPAAIYFDDIEKFGIWPETYQWVYEKGWLEDFIRGVLASPVIATQTYRAYHARAKTRGIVYLPTASYIEMNEWTLPAAVANAYADLVHEEKARGRYEAHKAFLRGGIWKNFLSRYPEANWMHKRMLGLSARLDALPQARRTPAMLDKLYCAQANDAYWHGLFGGLYLPHLRRAVYRALVGLEAELDRVAPRPPLACADADHDGIEEIFLHNGALQAVAKLDGAAALCELDAYTLAHNFGDTLCRRPEHYFRKIHAGEEMRHQGAGIASAHDRVLFKHDITPQDLAEDYRAKTLFDDRWRHDAAAQHPCYSLTGEDRTACAADFAAQLGEGSVEKRIALDDEKLTVRYRFRDAPGGVFATEINLAMPSCDGFAGRYILRGEIPCGFGQELLLGEMTEIVLDDGVLGGSVAVVASRPVGFAARPHFSVSQSEAGFEKIMQAVTLNLSWPLAPGAQEVTIALSIKSKSQD